MRNYYLTCLFALLAGNVSAHSFDERYDLPIPLEFFLVGGGVVVALSFLLIVLASFYWPTYKVAEVTRSVNIPSGLTQAIKSGARFMSFIFFLVVLAAGYWGPGNPLLNLAPNFIWITWWLGFSITISLLGNFWPLCDPWSTLTDVLHKFARTLGMKDVFEKPFIRFPKWLGIYVATIFLLSWSWMEVVYPIAFMPAWVATIALLWTAIDVLGAFLFGKTAWRERGDVFSIYFSMLGQFGVLAYRQKTLQLYWRLPGEGILFKSTSWSDVPGVAAFIIAMLAIVLFDGLHGSSAWRVLTSVIQSLGLNSIGSSEYALGTIGLGLVWLFFATLFYLACWISSRLTTTSVFHLTNIFATALIPIAVAYLVAHNFSSLLIQGQSIIFLISDPFGLGWDLFATSNFRPNIGLIDVSTTWYLAVFSIVLGHVIALILNHCLAMQMVGAMRIAALMTIPQTILMIMFTMLSLVIIAEPMTSSDLSLWQQICITDEAQ